MGNKTKNLVVSFAMLLFFFGLAFTCWIKPADEFSDSERRSLNQFPELTMETLLSGKFMSEFEGYTLDQFPFRDGFRTVKAIANNYILNQSDNNGIYVKDGYVSKMEYPLNEDSISYAAGRFAYVYEKFLEGTDVKAYLSIVPDKNYYLNDRTQLGLPYKELVSQMASQAAYMNYIDIMDSLSLESYYRTDTHWRQEMLIPIAQEIASGMGVELKAEYRKEIIPNDFYGVYYGQSALPLKPDQITYLTNDILEHVRVYDYQNQKEMSIYDMDKAYGKDPYEMYLSGSLSLITIENENATTEKELVVFRDSFGSSIVPLFVEAYQKITVVDIRYMHPNMLENFIEFANQDVLFLYSTLVLNNSEVIK